MNFTGCLSLALLQDFYLRMDNITLEQLQELFAGLRAQTQWDVDGEMLWGYFFTSTDKDKLERAAENLAQGGYDVAGIYQAEDEPMFVLHVERVEAHTPETLFTRNQQLEAFASEYELDAYDGMDVNPVDGEEDLEDSDEEAGEDIQAALEEFEPVTNPGLIEAIEAFEEDPSDEVRDDLTDELQSALYLVPVLNEADGEDIPDEGESVQILVCTDEEEREFVPLFTDVDALKAWTSEPVSAMEFSAAEAWEFVLSQPECAGAVINPAGEAFPLDRDFVTFLKEDLEEASEE